MENLLGMPKYADQAKAEMKKLEEARMVWVVTKVITDGKPGITSPTQKVVEAEVDGKLKCYQMELREDPTACFIRLGLKALVAIPEQTIIPELEEVEHVK